MNFVATANSSRVVARKSPAAKHVPAHAAGDTYSSVLVSFLKIAEQLKTQSVAMEHARNCAARQDWAGVQLGLAMLRATAQDIRKIAAAVNEKIGPEIDDCVTVYGEDNA